MKKWQEEAGDNQFFIRQQWKYITISRVPSEETSRQLCKLDCY
jgi:hypothetical protein